MKRTTVLLALVGLSFAACSLPGSPLASPTSGSNAVLPGEHCADLVASAMASGGAVVPGAFNCQDAALIANAKANGVTSDADIASLAKSLGYVSVVDLGGAPTVFTYLLSAPGRQPTVLILWMDSNGLVAHFQRAGHA